MDHFVGVLRCRGFRTVARMVGADMRGSAWPLSIRLMTTEEDTQHRFDAAETDWGFTSYSCLLRDLYDPVGGCI